MITVKVRIKKDNKSHGADLHFHDDYNLCKDNPDFQHKIKQVIEEVPFIDEKAREERDFKIKITAVMEEWE